IIRSLPLAVSKVGLFVNASPSFIQEVIAATGLDTVQLHGEETPEFCREFRGRVKVWKAFRVRGAETLAKLPAYTEATDAWLLDAYVAGSSGGTGKTFEWAHAVAAKELGRPIILAGGLTPENVAEAVRQVQPFAVDVSSGVEQSPGRKDPAKLRRFVAAAKGSGP
ncbi:MAG TPA: N-(5'-phosphoribosyl)anthranilate isomerase, partial [Verrucomicrobiales bacterium]|nr:N-(5'-phosphoribosyl)anthranilate isomerase [Verrucomicrobiales bacterium]